MVNIIIENLGQKEVAVTQLHKTAIDHFHAQFIDWMQSCGGKGRCTTCRMEVLEGITNLGELTSAEKKYKSLGLLKDGERLACQATVQGSIRVRVPEDCKLPHLKYTS